jgi:hypothetical protein
VEDDRASTTPLSGSYGEGEGDVVGEPRWPMVGAVVAAIVLTLLLPDDLRLGPNWALPVLEAVLLVVLIVADPGSITRRSRELRAVGIALVGVLGLSAMAATVSLIDSLVTGGPETDSASELLQAGAIVWISNNIAFARIGSSTAAARRRVHTACRRIPTSLSRSSSTRTSWHQDGARASSTTSISDSRTRPP